MSNNTPKKYCTIRPFDCAHWRDKGICAAKGYCPEAKEEQLPVDEHGHDFLGMPVVGNRELLVPVKEIRLFAEYVLGRTGSKLAKFRLAEMYGQYIHDVIKPKYEKK